MKSFLLLLAVLLATTISIPYSQTASALTVPNLTQNIQASIQAQEGGIDAARGIRIAESDPAYAAYSQDSLLSPEGLQVIWSYDASGVASLYSVNVLFSVSSQEGFLGYLVMVEDPSMSGVLQVDMQQASASYASWSTDVSWSGYGFTGNAGGTNPVYEAFATWTEPTASLPSSGCTLTHCDVGVWPGLAAIESGGTGLVQAGTDSGIYCILGCTYYHYAWYEFWSSPSSGPVTCSNFPVSFGDSMGAIIWNHAVNGGSSTMYDVYVNDYTTSKVCSALNQSFTAFTTPYYADFIVERPYLGGTSYARLPKFSTTSILAEMYYNSALQGSYSPFSNGWYDQITMVNGVYTNDIVGNVGSNNHFTVTWNTSSGT